MYFNLVKVHYIIILFSLNLNMQNAQKEPKQLTAKQQFSIQFLTIFCVVFMAH